MSAENRASARCSKITVIAAAHCALFIVFYYIVYANTGDDASTYTGALHLTTRHSIETMQAFARENAKAARYEPSTHERRRSVPYEQLIAALAARTKRFDVNGADVLVYLHIQKTAGTSFEKFLVGHLNITRPCVCSAKTKRCRCARPRTSREGWLFSRYSTGWLCGLHADYTELFVSGCVERSMDALERQHKLRRYFYITFLRHPVERFISEFRHVARGATWLRSRHSCDGRSPTPNELPLCFDPSTNWRNVTLDEFLSCPYNLAFNRQTRMLADLTLVNCYDTTALPPQTRDRVLLASAQSTLRSLAFFGLKERMADSQDLFEHLFGIKFTQQLDNWNKSKSADTVVSDAQMQLIWERNALDVQLYNYALLLFESRLAQKRKLVASDTAVPWTSPPPL